MDKSRFHNIRQLAEELTRYGIIYKLIDDLDIYDKPDIFDKYVRWLKTPKKFQNIINEFKPDMVITERALHFSLLVIKSKIPLCIFLVGNIWTEDAIFDKITKISLIRRIEIWYKRRINKKCLRDAELILALSQDLVNVVKQHYPNKKIRLISSDGIDESDWITDKKMDLKHPCVGLLQRAQVWGKAEEMLILTKILEEFPNVTFYWAGDGPYRDKLLEKLKKYDNFEWLGYLEYPDKVREYLASIDVYLLLSGLDTSPHTVLEAGLMKKPIVATSIGGVSNIIINGKTGFIVEKGNYKEYIEKISILINDEKKRKEMGINEYEFVKNNFTWKQIAKEFVSVIPERMFS